MSKSKKTQERSGPYAFIQDRKIGAVILFKRNLAETDLECDFFLVQIFYTVDDKKKKKKNIKLSASSLLAVFITFLFFGL